MTANPAARLLGSSGKRARPPRWPIRHICTLLDIGRQDDVDFLVLEFLHGDTLSNVSARGKLSLIRRRHL